MRTDPARGEGEIGRIGAGLRELDEALGRGDLTAKRYARAREALLAQLGRAKISPRLEAGEEVLREHHWTRGLESPPPSPLAEGAHVAESLYATDRRLFLWRFEDRPNPRSSPLEGFEESLEDLRLSEVDAVSRRWAFRWGEALAGGAVAAVALLAWRHLAVTGWAMLALGAAAVLHAIVWPTRRVVLVGRGGDVCWEVLAAGRPSGRDLLAYVEEKVAGRSR